MHHFKSISQYVNAYKKSAKEDIGPALETYPFEIEKGESEIFIIKNVEKYQDESTATPFVILNVINNSVLEEFYVEVSGIWLSDTEFSKGAIIAVSQDFQLYTHNPYIINKMTAIVNNDSGSITLYPHYLIYVRSIASSCRCLRKGYIYESIFQDTISTQSTIASFVQMCADIYIRTFGTRTLDSVIDQVISEHKNLIYLVGENETTIKNKLKKKLNALPKETTKNPDFIVPNDRRTLIQTRMFPKIVSSKKMVAHQTFKSFKLGLICSPSSIIETAIGKLMPLIIYSRHKNEELYDEHTAGASGIIDLFNERYGDGAEEAGFLWYISKDTDERFFVKPNYEQKKTLRARRNAVVAAIAENRIPPRALSLECENCIFKDICALFSRMEHQHIYEGDYSVRRPGSDMFYSTSRESDFFWHFHDILSIEALAEMECCTNISSTPVEKRVQQRIAIPHLKVKVYDKENNLVVLEYEGPQSVYAYHIRNHDSLIFTNDGTFPIIGSGIVIEIKYSSIKVSVKDAHFDIGQEVTVDVFTWSGAHRMKSASLCQIFLRKGGHSRLKELLIEGAAPRFSAKPLAFFSAGLNMKQKEAVSLALRAKDYALIHAPHGSGIVTVVSRIIMAHVKAGNKVLVAPYYYNTINSLISTLSHHSIKFIISGMSDFIDDNYKKYCDSYIFDNALDIEECDRTITKAQVYIVQSKKRSWLIDQISFDVSIIMDASIDDILTVMPQIIVADSFILTGDPTLDDSKDSAFNYFARNSPESVIKLTEIGETESQIIEAARLVWGNDLISFTDHATVEMDPLGVLPSDLQSIMGPILTMDSPIVFVDVRELMHVLFISMCAGLVYQRAILVSGELHMPEFIHAVYSCRNMQEMKNPPLPLFAIEAMQNVVPLRIAAVRNQRNDVGIFYADGQTDPMKLALSTIKRKVILLADVNQIRKSPIWTTIYSRLSKQAKFSFKNIQIPQPFTFLSSFFEDIL